MQTRRKKNPDLPPSADPEVNNLEEGADSTSYQDTDIKIQQAKHSKRVTHPVVT